MLKVRQPLQAAPLLFLAYFVFQIMYIPYAKLSVDEFWFAHHIYQYTHSLPYRDFPPYKTVLGYYLLMAPFYFFHSILAPLFWIKGEIALFNTIFLALTYRWMSRLFTSSAVMWTIVLIMANQLFLVYSVDLRVDMLSCWFGLFAVLFALEQRALLGGFCLSIGFLISQKTLWYFVAIDTAYVVTWLLIARPQHMIKEGLLFNLGVVAGIMLYIAFWATQSNLHEVLRSVFYEAYLQSKITWFAKNTYLFWQEMLTNGPILYFLWPLTWIALVYPATSHDFSAEPMGADKPSRTNHGSTELPTRSRVFLATFTAVTMGFVLTYKQPFPYNMVFSVPMFFVMYTDFFCWLKSLSLSKTMLSQRQQRALYWFISLYVIALASIIIIFDLPLCNFGIVFVPVLMYFLLKANPVTKSILSTCMMTLILITGICYPLVRFSMVATILEGRYQQAMITTANKILDHQDTYVAGFPVLYNREQPIAGMKNLITPAIAYLTSGDKSLEPILLPSLNMTVTTPEAIMRDFDQHPVKLLFNGMRITALPTTMVDYLYSHYAHFWGTLYLYAPIIQPTAHAFHLPFDGHYRVQYYGGRSLLLIDGKKVKNGDILFLSAGSHHTTAKTRYRLYWQPDHSITMDPAFAADTWDKMVKFIIL